MKTFIIAEAGVNHNGDEKMALALVEAAAESGADAVKFQTFSADKLTRRGAAKAEYQKQATGDGDQHEMLKALEMSEDLHRRLFSRCAELGIEFMSTAFDEESLDFLVTLGIRRIKIPSGEITNVPLLRHMASQDLPLILSTGMADLREVVAAVEIVRAERIARGLARPMADMVTILHCTSNYPAECSDVNLRAMDTLARGTGLAIGYSDHTMGLAVSTAAVARGATVIEKHFTLDRLLPGPDHKASLEPDELTALVRQIRDIEQALGSEIKAPTAAELSVRDLVRRSVTSVRPLAAGTTVGKDDVALMRPGTGIPPADLDKVIGRRLARDICAGETMTWSDIE
jgi:N,N'-diacetyllegionaminate synthase